MVPNSNNYDDKKVALVFFKFKRILIPFVNGQNIKI